VCARSSCTQIDGSLADTLQLEKSGGGRERVPFEGGEREWMEAGGMDNSNIDRQPVCYCSAGTHGCIHPIFFLVMIGNLSATFEYADVDIFVHA
jgi:hypothetical protein